MRPETAKRKINKMLWIDFIENDGLEKGLPYCVKKLKQIKPELSKMLKKAEKEEDDYRAGEETYGYNDSEHILERLSYLSDRWNCAFRIRWLIGLIDKYEDNK